MEGSTQGASHQRRFMPLGSHRIESTDGVVTIRHGRLETTLLLLGTFGFGPLMIFGILVGWLPLSDTPIWARAIAVVVPIASTAWLAGIVRERVIRPPFVVLDGVHRELRLVHPPTARDANAGWPERIDRDEIAGFEIETERDEDSTFQTLAVHLANDEVLRLFSIRSEAKMETVVRVLGSWLPVRSVDRT